MPTFLGTPVVLFFRSALGVYIPLSLLNSHAGKMSEDMLRTEGFERSGRGPKEACWLLVGTQAIVAPKS